MIQERTLIGSPLERQQYLVGDQEVREPAQYYFVDQLRTALEIVQLPQTPESIISQLNQNPIQLAVHGLQINLEHERQGIRQEGSALPQAIQTILLGLNNNSNANYFAEWIKENITRGNQEATTTLLKSLTQFSCQIYDEIALQQLFQTSDGNVNLRPLKMLFASATVINRTNAGDERLASDLAQITDMLASRFPKIIKSSSIYCPASEFSDLVAPDVDSIVNTAKTWVETNFLRGNMSEEETAHSIFQYFELSGLPQPSDAIFKFIASYPAIEALNLRLLKLGVASRLIYNLDSQIKDSVIRDKHEAIRQYPRKDFMEIDLHEIVPEGYSNIEVWLPHGSYGPFTLSHEFSIQLLRSQIAYKDAQDMALYGKLQAIRFLVAAPLTDLDKLNNYKKNPLKANTLTRRVQLMSIALADVPDVYITTLAQPDPAKAGDTYGMVTAIQEQFGQKARDELGEHVNLTVIPCAGTDEIHWVNRNVGPDQERKMALPYVLTTRRGSLVDCIFEARHIAMFTNASKLVLTPNRRTNGSTEAISTMWKGDEHNQNIHPAVEIFFIENWNQSSYQERGKMDPALRRQILPVSEIYRQLLEEI